MNLIARLFSIFMIFLGILINLHGALIGIYFFPVHLGICIVMIIIGSNISILGVRFWKKHHKK